MTTPQAPLHTGDPGRPRAPEPPELEGQVVGSGEYDDFDAWRAARKAKRGLGKQTLVFGRMVTMPSTMPLGLQIELEENADSSDMDDTKRLVAYVYGEDALEFWISKDADLDDFQILLAYGLSCAQGQNLSFDQIADRITAANQAQQEQADRKAKKKRKRSGNPAKRNGR